MVSQHAYSGYNRKVMGQDICRRDGVGGRLVKMIKDDAEHDFDVLATPARTLSGQEPEQGAGRRVQDYSVPLQ